jgi:ABC transporter substrate binding protein
MRLIGLAVVFAVSLILTPSAAVGQARSKSPRIAVLNPGAPEYFNDSRTCPHGFMQGLRDLGYVDGHNVQLEYRHARGQTTRLEPLAAELVRLSPDVIWTHSSDAIQAVKRATSTIPIVFGVAINSVEEGLVAALSRPGGNGSRPPSPPWSRPALKRPSSWTARCLRGIASGSPISHSSGDCRPCRVGGTLPKPEVSSLTERSRENCVNALPPSWTRSRS